MATEAASVKAPPARKFQFVGGNLSLDFTNTMGGKRGAIVREFLNSYRDLLSWFEQAGLIDERQVKNLSRRAASEPEEAASALLRATELREAIYRLFDSVAAQKAPSRADLDRLNFELARALGRLQLCPGSDGGCCTWTWKAGDDLAAPLGPVARAAADLLTNDHSLQQLGQCGGGNCGWLFIDSSKNHSRRWCDMRDCGNRAKVRRHRAKERGQRE